MTLGTRCSKKRTAYLNPVAELPSMIADDGAGRKFRPFHFALGFQGGEKASDFSPRYNDVAWREGRGEPTTRPCLSAPNKTVTVTSTA